MAITTNIPNMPNFPISPLAVIHFGFTGLFLLDPWLSQYMFVHLGLILMVIWAAHDRQSALAVIMYQICLLISFILDIVSLGYYFDRENKETTRWEFAAGMAILHIIAKPLMGLYALVVLVARRGSLKMPFKGRDANLNSNTGEESH